MLSILCNVTYHKFLFWFKSPTRIPFLHIEALFLQIEALLEVIEFACTYFESRSVLHCVYFASMLIKASRPYNCFDLWSSAGVWLHIIKTLRNEPCSDWLLYVCGNLGRFCNFSVSEWPRVWVSQARHTLCVNIYSDGIFSSTRHYFVHFYIHKSIPLSPISS